MLARFSIATDQEIMSRFAEAINASASSATIPGRPPGINIVYVVFLSMIPLTVHLPRWQIVRSETPRSVEGSRWKLPGFLCSLGIRGPFLPIDRAGHRLRPPPPARPGGPNHRTGPRRCRHAHGSGPSLSDPVSYTHLATNSPAPISKSTLRNAV